MNELARVFVKRIYIENFKSIKRLELDLNNGVNVLVGPNGSGKSNLLEAISFLYKALIEDKNKVPYLPHTPRYSSPLELIYMLNPNNKIILGASLEYYYKEKYKETTNIIKREIEFKVSFTYDGKTIIPTGYNISIGKDTHVELNTKYIKINITRELYDLAILKFKQLKEKYSEKSITSFLEDYEKDLRTKYYCNGKYCILIHEWSKQLHPPLFLDKLDIITSFSHCTNNDKEGHGICITIETTFDRRTGFVNIPYIMKHELVKMTRGKIIKDHIKFASNLSDINVLIERVLEGIMFLRHPDIGALREPQPFMGDTRLNERATNLASVLLALQGRRGSFPERISHALEVLFPNMRISIESLYGHVVLVAEENELKLPPPNIPDGLIKLLAILTAIELEPSILLIDELENSMHVRMLEYVIDELNSLDIPVLVATHSPVVVDLVGPERTIIVDKKPDEGTVVERIKDPKKLSKRLKELGVALSDYVFYKLTYKE